VGGVGRARPRSHAQVYARGGSGPCRAADREAVRLRAPIDRAAALSSVWTMNVGDDVEPVARVVARTKLRPPPQRSQVHDRPRLAARIERAVAGRTTLVSAPAGYGKTTALASWARVRPTPVAWLALDERDAWPVPFLRHVTAALAALEPGLAALPDPLEAGVDAALATLLNALDTAAGPRVLVLDDLHVVAVPEVLDLVRRLVEHAPEPLRLVLATRVDPALPLARWRLSGDLDEIGPDELRFDVAEARTLLQGLGLMLDAPTLELLVQRTEGWGAGLQLAGLGLRGRRGEGVHDFVERFTGRDRYVLDYLTEEVLQRLEPGLQDFLLMVSVLDTFDAATAAVVTGRPDAADVLVEVERANLFLARAEDGAYRFHPFFRDLLLGRLGDLRPDLPETLRRAAHADAQRRARPTTAGGDEPPATGMVPSDPLSARELEVLRWLATGASNKAIARRLDLSPNTVKTHLKRVYEKLGADSRTAAVARARGLGLI